MGKESLTTAKEKQLALQRIIKEQTANAMQQATDSNYPGAIESLEIAKKAYDEQFHQVRLSRKASTGPLARHINVLKSSEESEARNSEQETTRQYGALRKLMQDFQLKIGAVAPTPPLLDNDSFEIDVDILPILASNSAALETSSHHENMDPSILLADTPLVPPQDKTEDTTENVDDIAAAQLKAEQEAARLKAKLEAQIKTQQENSFNEKLADLETKVVNPALQSKREILVEQFRKIQLANNFSELYPQSSKLLDATTTILDAGVPDIDAFKALIAVQQDNAILETLRIQMKDLLDQLENDPEIQFNIEMQKLKSQTLHPNLKRHCDALIKQLTEMKQSKKGVAICPALVEALKATNTLFTSPAPDFKAYQKIANKMQGHPSPGFYALGTIMILLGAAAALLAATGFGLIIVATAAAISAASFAGSGASFFAASRKDLSSSMVHASEKFASLPEEQRHVAIPA